MSIQISSIYMKLGYLIKTTKIKYGDDFFVPVY